MRRTWVWLPHGAPARFSQAASQPARQSDSPPVSPSVSLLGPVDPSFRALSGRLKFTVRRPKFNVDYISRGKRGRRAVLSDRVTCRIQLSCRFCVFRQLQMCVCKWGALFSS